MVHIFLAIGLTCLSFFFASLPLRAEADTLAEKRVARPDSLENLKKFYAPSEFTYSGDRRFTLSGGLALRRNEIHPWLAAGVGTVFVGGLVGLHYLQQNAWWSDRRGTFHFQEDNDYALQADKAGHCYGGYIMSHIAGEALMESGFSWETSTILGGTMGLLYQTYVEVEDGFSLDWGFSPGDFYADALGASYYVAQHYVPFLQNFTPKWQFIPARWQNERPMTHPTAVVDDYNSSIFWLSADVYRLLPEQARQYWIPWLNIAVGYGIRNVGYDDVPPTRRTVIGLDANLVRLLPDGGGFWHWARQYLNVTLKLPMPAVEFGDATRFYFLYPFKPTAFKI